MEMTSQHAGHRCFIVLSFLVLTAGYRPENALAAETLHYTLTPLPREHRVRVELHWDTHDRTESALSIQPYWASVRDVPALVSHVQFGPGSTADRAGPRWTVTHGVDAAITLSYEVAGQKDDADWEHSYCPIVGPDYVHAIGETFLIAPDEGGPARTLFDVQIEWKLPEGWNEAVTSIGRGVRASARSNVHALRQSIFLAGRLLVASPTVMGKTVTVAMPDRFGFTLSDFAAMCARIIQTERQFVDDRDFPDYLVTAVCIGRPLQKGSSSMGGTGLHNSFATFLAPGAAIDDSLQHLLAHELFHHWNGRVLDREPPEEHVYWFSEGFTEYYSLRVLLDSGIWDAATFARWINRHLAEYQSNPARNARNEQIQREFWSERRTVGEAPYQRGVLLGLRWHARARRDGKPEGIDILLRELLRRAVRDKLLLSNDRIRAIGTELLGEWFADEFDRYVTRAETIELPPDALGPAFRPRRVTRFAYAPGFDSDRSVRDKRIHGLVAGSPAARAGLREDDEVAGMNLYGDPDREAELKVRRDGKIEAIRFFPRGAAFEVLQFEPSQSEPHKPGASSKRHDRQP